MKMKIAIIMALCLSACMIAPSVFGDSAVTTIENDDFYSAPIVPVEVIVGGRQTVTSYLVSQIDYAIVKYGGRSIIGEYQEFLGTDELKARGYIHKGSFSEFSDAVAQTKFKHSVVKTPNGYYDVSVTVEAHSADGRICLTGNGYLRIEEDKGGLTVGEFDPYMGIPSTLIIKGPGLIDDAKWLSPNYNDEDLNFRSSVIDEVVTTSVFIPTRILESGYLIIAGLDGKLSGIDLKNKVAIAGEEVIALLGHIRSSDIISLKEPSTWSGDWSRGDQSVFFSKFQGQVYGRFPVIDFVTPVAVKTVILPQVRILGTDHQMMLPAKITVTTVWSNAPTSQERELLFSPAAGGYLLDVPAGGYHIKAKFDILDPEQNPDRGM